ncbi:MAG TPA: prepilin-type N-terminal cleavage/methylation domain-containing protein, partial [Gammaproteobacteria bacterium]|nr:prepilin-type N-terminal cleavage/methylation domain-containing protein [Gammaproteobacteria bacterium]
MTSHTSTFRGQAGFTLVELMVALAVSFIVLFGIGQIFINSKRTAALQEEQAAIQENG